MDHVEDSLVGKIVGIANNKNLPYRLRVAALEAYMADPCKEKFRDTALNILKDIQQDSEVRIKAYLAAAQCPNAKVAKALKTLLDDEPSYQGELINKCFFLWNKLKIFSSRWLHYISLEKSKSLHESEQAVSKRTTSLGTDD